MTSGAPNCQSPPWSPEELAIIGSAWDIAEAWENYRIAFGFNNGRTMRAIESCWCRLHPVMDSHNTPLERLLGEALDELEGIA